ncbi:MAG: LptF/LptG family permease, partial [Bacteroidota bacterium]|nr:LptF/LptG family permease [Bacteroidota bacterium]
QKFMFPLIILIIAVSISAFFYSNRIMPYTNLKIGSLIYDIKHKNPELQIQEGIFYNGIEDISIKIRKKNYKTNLLQDVMIYDHRNNKGNYFVTIADSGYMKITPDETRLVLTLYNGHTYEEMEESKKNKRNRKIEHPHQQQEFEKQVLNFDLAGIDLNRTDEDLFKNNFHMLNLEQLEYAEDSLTKKYKEKVHSFSKNIYNRNYFKRETVLKRQLRQKKDLKKKFVKHQEKISNKNVEINNNTKNIKIKAQILHDTVDTKHIKIDSLYHSLSLIKKQKSIKNAITYARATHNVITNSKKQFNYKREIIRRHAIEWHRKFSLSFACLVFFLIGAPFGAIVRKGGLGTPVVISVLFFIIYYMISIAGEKFVREGVLPAYIGMWISSYILFPIGIFLSYKATTDSAILNSDAYSIFFKKLIQKIKPKK